MNYQSWRKHYLESDSIKNELQQCSSLVTYGCSTIVFPNFRTLFNISTLFQQFPHLVQFQPVWNFYSWLGWIYICCCYCCHTLGYYISPLELITRALPIQTRFQPDSHWSCQLEFKSHMSPQVKIFERPRQTALSLLGLQFSAADNFAIPIFCEIESSATLTAIGSQQTLFFLLSSLIVNRDKSLPKYLLLFPFWGVAYEVQPCQNHQPALFPFSFSDSVSTCYSAAS